MTTEVASAASPATTPTSVDIYTVVNAKYHVVFESEKADTLSGKLAAIIPACNNMRLIGADVTIEKYKQK